MKSSFVPVLNKLYVFEQHSLLFWESGSCRFEVDFKVYNFSGEHVISISPGQYFRLISGPTNLIFYEFSDKTVSGVQDSRLLFRHIVSVGHISITNSSHFRESLSNLGKETITGETSVASVIEDWLELNPFQSSLTQINLLFDIKEVIDRKYREPLSTADVARELRDKPYRVTQIINEKLDSTIHLLAKQKLGLEARKKVVYSDLSVKEIAYELGFKDPHYFSRFFKQQTSFTPVEFRNEYELDERDSFKRDLLALIDTHFREHRFAAFYAGQLAMTPQSLSRKIAQKLATTFTDLLSERILQEAKMLLLRKMPVNIIAFNLGFKEPNHFSSFFKNINGKTPTQFLADFQ